MFDRKTRRSVATKHQLHSIAMETDQQYVQAIHAAKPPNQTWQELRSELTESPNWLICCIIAIAAVAAAIVAWSISFKPTWIGSVSVYLVFLISRILLVSIYIYESRMHKT